MTTPNRAVRPPRPVFSGVTLLELLVAVVLLGIIAAVALPRLSGNALDAKKNACYVNKGDVEVQVELWYRNHGSWPAADLGDVGADAGYFPDGLPTCPVNGTPYTLDSATHRVVNHDHP
jgi:prepilin-type N-terminal cleavage/methylation domain-containing protein